MFPFGRLVGRFVRSHLGIFAVHGVLDGGGGLPEDRVGVRVPLHHLPLLLEPGGGLERGVKLQFSAGRDIHLANSRLSVTVVNAFHKRMVSIPTPTIPPAIPMIIPK